MFKRLTQDLFFTDFNVPFTGNPFKKISSSLATHMTSTVSLDRGTSQLTRAPPTRQGHLLLDRGTSC